MIYTPSLELMVCRFVLRNDCIRQLNLIDTNISSGFPLQFFFLCLRTEGKETMKKIEYFQFIRRNISLYRYLFQRV